MHAFEFVAPTTIADAVAALADGGDEARVLAGATDLIAQMQEGRRRPRLLVDIKRIPELLVLEYDDASGLKLGAGVSCTRVANHPAVQKHYPMLAASCRLVGAVQIQNRATVGGNLCNAAPSADTVPALVCLGAEAVVAGPEGERTVAVEAFATGPGRTVMRPGELLVGVRIPPPPAAAGGHYLRFTPREEMDIAVAGVGALVTLDRDTGRCIHARIALASVAPTTLRVPDAEAKLVGEQLEPALMRQAAEACMAAARPISDVRGSADYRRHLVGVLTERVLAAAKQQIAG